MDNYCSLIVNQTIKEIDNYRTDTRKLSDRAEYCMYQLIQNNATYQNKEFLAPLNSEAVRDGVLRDFYDILDPMIETGVNNSDIDTDNIQVYVDKRDNLAAAYLSTCVLRQYLRQTNHGEKINDNLYFLFDDGNLLVRHLEGSDVRNDGEVYRRVMPQNIIVTDTTAETPEQTTIIEKNVMNEQEVRAMKWNEKAKQKVFEYCNVGSGIPYYEVFYRYGELKRSELEQAKAELEGNEAKFDGVEDFIQTITISVRPKNGTKYIEDGIEKDLPGVLVFAEELKPKTYKITKKIKIKVYKPYQLVRLGKYNGRFWGEGYREKGKVYQDRANQIANELRESMRLASKTVFWSTDEAMAGKSVMTSIKTGDIIPTQHLGVLNNTFPNLSLYAEEWNRNITECQKALKAFEVATGENLPSSTSATAINVQNTQIGKYHNFKREKYGLFLSVIMKRWILTDLLSKIDEGELIELVGEATFIDEVMDAYINGLWNMTVLDFARAMVVNQGVSVPTEEMKEMFKEMQKEKMLKEPKLYIEAHKSILEDVEMYVGLDITGEGFNKQAKISNAIALLSYETDPNEKQDTVNWIKQSLGLPVKRYKKPVQQPQQQQQQPAPQGQPLSLKEQPDNPNML